MDDAAHDAHAPHHSDDSPVRARAEAALAGTADCAVPFRAGEHSGPSGPELDARVDELALLAEESERAAGQEVLRARLRARLGTLVATRYVLGQRPQDRLRARELLQEARESALLDAECRGTARRDLVALLASRLVRLEAEVREAGVDATDGLRLDDVRIAMEAGRPERYGGSGLPEDTQLLLQLLPANDSENLNPEQREHFLLLGAALEAMRRDDMHGVFASAERLVRSGRHEGSFLPRLLNSVLPTLASLLPHDSAADAEEQTPNPTGGMNVLWEILALTEAQDPGTLAPAELPKLLGALTGRADTGPDDSSLSARMIAAMLHLAQATRTGDMTGMNAGLKLVHEAFTAGEFDADQLTDWLPGVTAGMLAGASMTGGSLQDEELADAILRDLDRTGGPPGGQLAITLRACGHFLRLQIALSRASDSGDLDAVESVLLELQELDDALAGAEEWVTVMHSFLLGSASLAMALLSRTTEDVRTAVHHFEQVMEQSVDIPALRKLLDASWAPLLALTATVEKDPSRLAAGIERTRSTLEGPGVTFDFESRVRSALAIALETLYELTGDPAALDEAVTELRHARAALPPDAPGNASVHGSLAKALAGRAGTRPSTPEATEDLRAAVGAARDALRATADDVLLQAGVRHGLRMARQGADRGRTAALWALRIGDPEEAVGCLEAGRSLVLRAAAVSSGVADRLAALGARDLAERWRTTASAAEVPAADGVSRSPLDELLSGSPGGPSLPGDLRRESLALLRGRERPADEPSAETVTALRAGLARSGVDALVHLVPGSGTEDGALLLVTPQGPVGVVRSPALSGDGRAPVRDFLTAGAARQRLESADVEVSHQEHDRADRAWSAALTALCDWAGGVVGPVLDHLGLWERALHESGLTRHPADADGARGAAPDGTRSADEHGTGTPDPGDTRSPDPADPGSPDPQGTRSPEPADPGSPDPQGTRSPEPADSRAPGAEGPREAAVRLVLVPCGELGVVPWQAAVLRPPAGAGGPDAVRLCEVAVVSHAASGREFLRASARRRMRPAERPALVFHGHDLMWAEEEVEVLQERYYPDAEHFTESNGTTPTPEAVLGLLGARDDAPASLVHLACHGLAGPDPTASALRLAPPPAAAADGAVSADLTLSTLLDAPSGGAPPRTPGPLVVCSACETDLTTRDHDEALTVTSVLVHRVAADAIGSRWRVPDGSSEILMLVLHDRLAAGLAPPDALRAAQRWMITPPDLRPAVAGLADVSGYRLRQDFRERPETWAAFVHQGNPAPAAPPETAQGGIR
ncbi:CHAT domain-containing protein [Streptomyces sp. WG7]|uniref:CHAT domain-containing protein n=1 Tax=Streptomyces sp. WG7 TaxID=3417650 RepID=UPI003CF3889A